MTVGGSYSQIASGGDLIVRLDSGIGNADAVVIGHAQLGVHHDAQAVLIAFIGIIGFSHPRIIGEGNGIVARNAAAGAIDMAEVPVSNNVAVFGSPAEKLDRLIGVAVFISLLGFLQIIGPERKVEIGQTELRRRGQVGEEPGFGLLSAGHGQAKQRHGQKCKCCISDGA
jgi:hypothetical protein